MNIAEETPEQIKVKLASLITENLTNYPLIAQQWEIDVRARASTILQDEVQMGRHGSLLRTSYPFYKTISTPIDPEKLK